MKFTQKDIEYMVSESVNRILKENNVDELVAYHGSAADFDEFDLRFVLTGEGTEQYGRGIYVSGVKDTGKMYSTVANYKKKNIHKTPSFSAESMRKWRRYINAISGLIKRFSKSMPAYKIVPYLMKKYQKLYKDKDAPASEYEKLKSVKTWKDLKKLQVHYMNLALLSFTNTRYLYTVEIPDSGYIDWDETDKNLLKDIYDKFCTKFNITDIDFNNINTFGDLMCYLRGWVGIKSEPLRNNGLKQDVISNYLQELGFNGITVEIGRQHGGDGDGDNYVIFNPKNVKIIGKEIAAAPNYRKNYE